MFDKLVLFVCDNAPFLLLFLFYLLESDHICTPFDCLHLSASFASCNIVCFFLLQTSFHMLNDMYGYAGVCHIIRFCGNCNI